MFGVDDIISVGMKILDKVIPDPAAKAEAQAKLLEIQQQGRMAELQADNVEAQELSKRQAADMASDSWLSKNIRPMTLIAILSGYFIFAGLSAGKINVNSEYVHYLTMTSVSLIIASTTQFEVNHLFSLVLLLNCRKHSRLRNLRPAYCSVVFCAHH
jgi:uncharacterized membrane protein (DUF106 family)